METRSNRIFVGFVIALALAALVAFALWLTAGSRSSGRPYDIVLDRSVSGLLVGSPVTFSGVRVGRVASIDLDRGQPGQIRVRIDITDPNLPISEGVVAHLEGDLLFGVALITLEQGEAGGPELLAKGDGDVPVIPVESGGLASLASDPTPMVESIAYATDRLMEVTTPEEQARITARLEDMAKQTGEMAAQGPAISQRIADARAALKTGTQLSIESAQKARTMRRDLDARSAAKSRELRASMAAARDGMSTLDARIQASRTGIAGASQSAADMHLKIEAARAAVRELSATAEELDRKGSGSLLSGPPTPTYDPKRP